MLKKIDVLLPNTSQYGVLHHFTTKLYEALVRQSHGISCRLLEGDSRLHVPIEEPPDLTLAFNGTLKDENGVLLCDRIKVPHIACLVDPPYRFLPLLESPYILLTCDDRYCCEYLKQRNFSRMTFMPHAIEKDIEAGNDRERIYNVVMLATFIDCDTIQKNWKSKFSVQTVRSLNDAADMTFADQTTSFIEALNITLEVNKAGSPENLPGMLQELELFIKGKERANFMRTIDTESIHVFGNAVGDKGWEDFINEEKLAHVKCHRSVPFNQALAIMKKSKIILNSSIKNKNGAHERIFSALASGAIVITSDNSFLRETYPDGNGIIFFQNDRMEQINREIHKYLSDEPKRQNIAQAGRKIVLEHHTWDQRAKTLLQELPAIIKLLA
jgi:spore maturation protein CgeB